MKGIILAGGSGRGPTVGRGAGAVAEFLPGRGLPPGLFGQTPRGLLPSALVTDAICERGERRGVAVETCQDARTEES